MLNPKVKEIVSAELKDILTLKDMFNFDKISTVAEVIAALSELPQDLPCYFRPKYSGPVEYTQNVGIKAHNISEMHPDKRLYPNEPEKYVCFLV